MVNIKKDNRKWKVALTLDNDECPYLYYPANYHGCRVLGDEDNDCSMDDCPYRSPKNPLQNGSEVCVAEKIHEILDKRFNFCPYCETLLTKAEE